MYYIKWTIYRGDGYFNFGQFNVIAEVKGVFKECLFCLGLFYTLFYRILLEIFPKFILRKNVFRINLTIILTTL